ncbi:MAG: Spy/CpxP family protein refolding chaperone [Myxococcaceae bacterium]
MKKSAIVAAVLVGAVSVTMLAGWGRWGGPMDAQKISRIVGAHVDNALDEVDATDAQRVKIKALQDQLVQDGIKLRDGNKESRQALVAQWESPTVDRDAVHSIVDKRIDDVRAFAHKVADTFISVHDILTPTQRATLSAKAKERME